MRKKIALLLSLILCMGVIAGCSPNEDAESSAVENSQETSTDEVSTEEVSTVDDTGGDESQEDAQTSGEQLHIYQGSSFGHVSDIVVNVGMQGDEIVSIEVIECEDSPHIKDVAMERMPERIIKHQSTNVDSITGATFTSSGIKNAVNDALEQSEVDPSNFQAEVNIDFEPAEDQEYDVVVVGGGLGGLTAAVGLMTDDELGMTHSGLDVLLLEKLAYTGGSVRVSDAVMLMTHDTPYNEVAGAELDPEDLITYAKSTDVNGYMNEELFRKILNHGPTTWNGLLNHGIYLPPENAKPGYIHGDPNHGLHFAEEDGAGESEPLDLEHAYFFTVRNPYTGRAGLRSEEGVPYTTNDGGPYLAQSLENIAVRRGAEIRTDAAVENLLVDENGNVTGVHVKDKNNYTEYDVNAKRVIVATGLLGHDPETMEKWSDERSTKAIHFGQAGADGDGHQWAEDLGGTIFNGEQTHYILGFDGRFGQYGEPTNLIRLAPSIWVNNEGVRFVNEGGERDPYAEYNVIDQPDNIAYGIIDSNNAYVNLMEPLLENNLGWKADTLEDLAQEIGLPEDAFMETVNSYNEARESGEDDTEFGTPNEQMASIEEGPFYAYPIRSLNNATDASVKVNDKLQIVREDGSTVEGVYFAGSIVVSNYGFMDGGFSHMTAPTSGSYAANLVRQDLIEMGIDVVENPPQATQADSYQEDGNSEEGEAE